MADSHRAADALRQAEEMYSHLAEEYPDTPQGQEAHERLLELCESYERAGNLHQARAWYERML